MGLAVPSRRWWLFAVGAVLVAVIGVLVAYRAFRGRKVEAFRVRRADVVQTVVTSGRVLPVTEAALGLPAGSTVERVPVDEGDRVAENEVLLVADTDEAQAALEQARARVARAQARLRQVEQAGSALAAERLRQARLAAEQAEQDLARAERLAEAGAVPRTDVEQAQLARDLAQSRVEAAAVELAETAPRGSEAELAAAELAEAEAAVAAAKARLEQLVVRAPADGTVVDRRVDPGTAVQPGQAALTFVADGPTRLVVEPDEANLALIDVGQPATASTEAFPERTFDAEVSWIAPAVDPDRGTVEVRLVVPVPPPYLRADMTVSVEIVVGRARDALVVPASAVRDAASDASWVVLVRDGKGERRPVQVGLEGDAVVEVRRGLAEGDVVVTEARVRPGHRVRPRVGGG